MKREIGRWALIAAMVLVVGVTIGLYAVVTSSPVEAQGYGNVESVLERIADEQPRRFVTAVKETVQEVVPQNLRAAFRDRLKEKLGLEVFGAGLPEQAVENLRILKGILDNTAGNSDAIFAAILQAIEPLGEGEGEGGGQGEGEGEGQGG